MSLSDAKTTYTQVIISVGEKIFVNSAKYFAWGYEKMVKKWQFVLAFKLIESTKHGFHRKLDFVTSTEKSSFQFSVFCGYW